MSRPKQTTLFQSWGSNKSQSQQSEKGDDNKNETKQQTETKGPENWTITLSDSNEEDSDEELARALEASLAEYQQAQGTVAGQQSTSADTRRQHAEHHHDEDVANISFGIEDQEAHHGIGDKAHCLSQWRTGDNPVEDLVGWDPSAGKLWIYPTNYPVRDYQFSVVRQAMVKNTLVTLPTGLGKTFIAAVLMYNFYRWYPEGKVVFMAPTKPLVAQQIQACYHIMGIPRQDTAEMTGSMNPTDRKSAWRDKRVFFLTPQVMTNDLSRGSCAAEAVRCLVVDEAHKALGNHAYCQVVRELVKYTRQFRVLALSATPGSDIKAIQKVVSNLLISHIEMRSEDSPDIKPYTHERTVDKIVVPLGEELSNVKATYMRVLEVVVRRLTQQKVLYNRQTSSLSKFLILKARDAFRQNPPESLPRAQYGVVEGDFALAMSLYHGLELLQLHGLRSLHNFLEGIINGTKAYGRTRTELMKNADFNEIMDLLNKKFQPSSQGVKPSLLSGHPKLVKLEEVVLEHFHRYQADGQATRVMIFSQYRDSVQEITTLLQHHQPLVKVMSFIGQASQGKATKGFTQKEQLKVMQAFRTGGYNVLVSTCVGEEGLDIGDVDLIVCYDAHKSPIRLVQRMGRTGRKRQGRIVMLMTEGKEEQIYNHSQYSRRSIHRAILNGARSLVFYDNNPRMIPPHLTPACHKMHITVQSTPPTTTKTTTTTTTTKGAGKARAKDRGRRKGTTVETGGITLEEFVELKSTGCVVTAPALPRPTMVSLTPAQQDGGDDDGDDYEGDELDMAEWLPWQNSLQETSLFGHSRRSRHLVELLEFVDLQQALDPTEDNYGQEMGLYLDMDDVIDPQRPVSNNIAQFIRPCSSDQAAEMTRSTEQHTTAQTGRDAASVKTSVDKHPAKVTTKTRRKRRRVIQSLDLITDMSDDSDFLPDVDFAALSVNAGDAGVAACAPPSSVCDAEGKLGVRDPSPSVYDDYDDDYDDHDNDGVDDDDDDDDDDHADVGDDDDVNRHRQHKSLSSAACADNDNRQRRDLDTDNRPTSLGRLPTPPPVELLDRLLSLVQPEDWTLVDVESIMGASGQCSEHLEAFWTGPLVMPPDNQKSGHFEMDNNSVINNNNNDNNNNNNDRMDIGDIHSSSGGENSKQVTGADFAQQVHNSLSMNPSSVACVDLTLESDLNGSDSKDTNDSSDSKDLANHSVSGRDEGWTCASEKNKEKTSGEKKHDGQGSPGVLEDGGECEGRSTPGVTVEHYKCSQHDSSSDQRGCEPTDCDMNSFQDKPSPRESMNCEVNLPRDQPSPRESMNCEPTNPESNTSPDVSHMSFYNTSVSGSFFKSFFDEGHGDFETLTEASHNPSKPPNTRMEAHGKDSAVESSVPKPCTVAVTSSALTAPAVAVTSSGLTPSALSPVVSGHNSSLLTFTQALSYVQHPSFLESSHSEPFSPDTDHQTMPHTDYKEMPHTDHKEMPHTDHKEMPHTDHKEMPHTYHDTCQKMSHTDQIACQEKPAVDQETSQAKSAAAVAGEMTAKKTLELCEKGDGDNDDISDDIAVNHLENDNDFGANEEVALNHPDDNYDANNDLAVNQAAETNDETSPNFDLGFDFDEDVIPPSPVSKSVNVSQFSVRSLGFSSQCAPVTREQDHGDPSATATDDFDDDDIPLDAFEDDIDEQHSPCFSSSVPASSKQLQQVMNHDKRPVTAADGSKAQMASDDVADFVSLPRVVRRLSTKHQAAFRTSGRSSEELTAETETRSPRNRLEAKRDSESSLTVAAQKAPEVPASKRVSLSTKGQSRGSREETSPTALPQCKESSAGAPSSKDTSVGLSLADLASEFALTLSDDDSDFDNDLQPKVPFTSVASDAVVEKCGTQREKGSGVYHSTPMRGRGLVKRFNTTTGRGTPHSSGLASPVGSGLASPVGSGLASKASKALLSPVPALQIEDDDFEDSIMAPNKPKRPRLISPDSTVDNMDEDDFEESVIAPKRLKRAKLLSPDSTGQEDDISDERQQPKKKRKKKRCGFLDEEAELSDDVDVSSDEDEENADLLEGSFIDNCTQLSQASQIDMQAVYMKSVRSPDHNPHHRQGGRYRLQFHPQPPITEVFSQQPQHALEDESQYLEDSFCVGSEEDLSYASSEEEEEDSILEGGRKGRQSKRKRPTVRQVEGRKRVHRLAESSSEEDETFHRLPASQAVMPQARSVKALLSSSDEQISTADISVSPAKDTNNGAGDDDFDSFSKPLTKSHNKNHRGDDEISPRTSKGSKRTSGNDDFDGGDVGWLSKPVSEPVTRTHSLSKPVTRTHSLSKPVTRTHADEDFSSDLSKHLAQPVKPVSSQGFSVSGADRTHDVAEGAGSLVKPSTSGACAASGDTDKARNTSGPFTSITSKERGERGRVVVLVDSREISGAQDVLSALRLEHSCTVHSRQLSHCDYLVSNRMAVNRINMTYFSSSSNRNKLLERLQEMQQLYDRCVLVVEKDRIKPGQERPAKVIHNTKYMDTMTSYLCQTMVRLIFTDNQSETASMLAQVATMESRKGMSITAPVELTSAQEQVVRFYLSLPKLSVAHALNLAFNFTTIHDFMHSSVKGVQVKGHMSFTRATEVVTFVRRRFTAALCSSKSSKS